MPVVSELGAPLNKTFGGRSNSASSTSNNTTEIECHTITDPRAIKRLQNRVAQRSYRRRVKLRLAELQERIARYEGTNPLTEDEELPNITTVVSAPDTQDVNRTVAGHLTPQSSFGSAKLERTVVSQEAASSAPRREHKTLRSNSSIVSHGSSPENCLTSRHQLSGSVFAHTEEGRSQSESDRLRQRVDNLHYFNEPHEDFYGRHREHVVDSGIRKKKLIDTTHQHQQIANSNPNPGPSRPFSAPVATAVATTHPFTTDELSGGLDFGFLMASTEDWTSCSYDKPTEHSSKSLLDVSVLSNVQSATTALTNSASSSNPPNADDQTLASISLSLNKRFQSIMECIGTMGFENFDELVTSYYVDEFEEASQLFHEQHFSRHRRLPAVFADILEGARRWKPSERRGLGEEVLKEAEAVLIAESSQAWKALQPLTSTGAFEQDCRPAFQNNSTFADHLRQNLWTIIPTEMPNLWALLMTLIASDGPAWQRNCSGTALAIIALLHLAGRLPKDTMLELVGACL